MYTVTPDLEAEKKLLSAIVALWPYSVHHSNLELLSVYRHIQVNGAHRGAAALVLALLCLALPSLALALSLQEEERVEAMLQALSRKKNMRFIRNRTEYDAEKAVSHLRLKLGNTRNRLRTAEQFVDNVASRSSMSGKEYMIRTGDAAPQPAGPVLRKLLKEALWKCPKLFPRVKTRSSKFL